MALPGEPTWHWPGWEWKLVFGKENGKNRFFRKVQFFAIPGRTLHILAGRRTFKRKFRDFCLEVPRKGRTGKTRFPYFRIGPGSQTSGDALLAGFFFAVYCGSSALCVWRPYETIWQQGSSGLERMSFCLGWMIFSVPGSNRWSLMWHVFANRERILVVGQVLKVGN